MNSILSPLLLFQGQDSFVLIGLRCYVESNSRVIKEVINYTLTGV